jgi:hypothetical protein
MATLTEPSRTVWVNPAPILGDLTMEERSERHDAPLEASRRGEPVVAFRGWRADEGRLRSPYVPVYWERTNHAFCNRAAMWAPGTGSGRDLPHRVPSPGCSCGIHAFAEADRDMAKVDHRGVLGIVTLWGNIEVHPDGMRGEYARIEALALYSRWTRRQKAAVFEIAEKLEVELVDLDELEVFASVLGSRLAERAARTQPHEATAS